MGTTKKIKTCVYLFIILPLYSFSQSKDYGNILNVDMNQKGSNDIHFTWHMSNSDFGEKIKVEKTYDSRHWHTVNTQQYNNRRTISKYTFSDKKIGSPFQYRLVQYNTDSSLVYYGPFSLEEGTGENIENETFRVTLSSDKLKVNDQLSIKLNKQYDLFTVVIFNKKGKMLYHERVFNNSEVNIDITKKFRKKHLSLYIKTKNSKSLINIRVI